MPKISVIVPIYKVEPYLRRCVDSILAQTFTDFECILVDDGSPDSCPAICDEYAEKDSRVVVIHQQNGGLSVARNAGIDWTMENSDSKWITFIDSDDWVHPMMLELLYIATQHHKTNISSCRFFETDGENAALDNIPEAVKMEVEEAWIKESLLVTACGKLYRKNCFTNIRYPIGKLHEDEYVTYQILFSKKEIAVVPAMLYYYFQNNGGITHSEWIPRRLDALPALDAQINYFKENCFERAYNRAVIWKMNCIAKNIAALENKTEYFSYQKTLRAELRNMIRNYRKEVRLSFEKNGWIFNAAYPTEMRVYWLFYAVINKFKKKIKSRR